MTAREQADPQKGAQSRHERRDGVWHSEHNLGQDMLRFCRSGFIPMPRVTPLAYGIIPSPGKTGRACFLHLVSGKGGAASVQMSPGCQYLRPGPGKGRGCQLSPWPRTVRPMWAD